MIRLLKKCTLLVAAIFAISAISGYLYAVLSPLESAGVMQELSDEFGWIMDLDPVQILFVIFLNNAFKSFLAMVLGLLVIVPIMFIALNGYILGIVVCESARVECPLYVAAAILPHGVIELPLVILSAALGTRIGAMVLSRVGGTTSTEEILSTLKWSISFYFRWILPLLFVAAAIEAFITPAVLRVLG